MGINAGSHHLTTLFLSRQFQPNNLPVYKLCETVAMQPMWWNPNINICLSNTTGLHQGWKKVMELEYRNWCRFAPSHCHTSSRQLQPNNLTAYKPWQCNPCGATYVVQPKHQHIFVQYHWFARRLGEKRAIRIWEWMQVCTISQLYF